MPHSRDTCRATAGHAGQSVAPAMRRPAGENQFVERESWMSLTKFRFARSFAVATLFGAALLPMPNTDALAEPQTYQFDKNHTQISISWNHLGLSEQSLRFSEYSGSLTFDEEDVSNSSVAVTIDPASVDSGVADFDDHLRSSDFFHVEEHDEITFETTEVVRTGPNTGRMTGDLTIKGITKPVTLDVTLNFSGEHPLAAFNDQYKGRQAAGFTATGRVLRSDFDLGRFAPMVSDWVNIQINTELYYETES
jgi:polyisoprenoid-binding protein YceI